jgi:hypothetical protein
MDAEALFVAGKGRRMLAGVMKGARHEYAVQTPRSVREWGLLIGESMLDATRRLQPPEVLRAVTDAADKAMDTREAQVVLVPFAGGLGKVLFVPEVDSMFSKWDWLTEPPPAIALEVRLDVMAEHLHRLAWALREGRPHSSCARNAARRSRTSVAIAFRVSPSTSS